VKYPLPRNKYLFYILFLSFIANGAFSQGLTVDAANELAFSVVKITAEMSDGSKITGTGFVWPDANHVVTCYHITG